MRIIKGIKSIRGIKSKAGGFTLVELIVYMGMFSILLIALTQIFMTIIETQLKTQAVTSSAQDGQYLYSRLIYDVHHADAIFSPAALGEVSNSLQLIINGVTHTYSLNGTVLQVNDGTGTFALNSYDTNISDVQFHRLGNVGGKHTVRINFTVTSKTESRGNPDIRIFQTTAGLR
jgi:type II secretory pathway pseudopilin PulG